MLFTLTGTTPCDLFSVHNMPVAAPRASSAPSAAVDVCAGPLPRMLDAAGVRLLLVGCAVRRSSVPPTRRVDFVAMVSFEGEALQPTPDYHQDVARVEAARLTASLPHAGTRCRISVSRFATLITCPLCSRDAPWACNSNSNSNGTSSEPGLSSASISLRVSSHAGGGAAEMRDTPRPHPMLNGGVGGAHRLVVSTPLYGRGSRRSSGQVQPASSWGVLLGDRTTARGRAFGIGWRRGAPRAAHCTSRRGPPPCDAFAASVRATSRRASACARWREHEAYPAGKQSYRDQALLNNLGLVYARAAGYGAVAFLDLDERRGPAPALREAVRAMQQRRQQAFLFAFMRTNLCARCPSTAAEAAAVCAPNMSRGGGIGMTKPIVVPRRVSWVGVHEAYATEAPALAPSASSASKAAASAAASPDIHHFSACLLHPVPAFRMEGLARYDDPRWGWVFRFWRGGDRWATAPPDDWRTAFEAPAELYGW